MSMLGIFIYVMIIIFHVLLVTWILRVVLKLDVRL